MSATGATGRQMQHATQTIQPAAADHAWDGELTIAHARSFHERVVRALDAGARSLDLTGITHIDGAGLQLLLLLRREADGLGLAFDGVRPSRAVRIALDMAQVDDALRPILQGGGCAGDAP